MTDLDEPTPSIRLLEGVSARPQVRRDGQGDFLECETRLPILHSEETRAELAGAIAAINLRLADSKFVLTDEGVSHLASRDSARSVAGAIASARTACARHWKELFHVSLGHGQRPPPAEEPPAAKGPRLVRHVSARISNEQLDELRLEVEARRPSFAARAARHLMFELVENPWFERHRLLHVQSASRIPAMEMMACIMPSGSVRLLSGQPATFNRIARAEGVAIAGDEEARAYTSLATSWTRAAEFAEMIVASFDEIPFRKELSAAEREQVQRLREEVGDRVRPMQFARTQDGWRLELWQVSVSRLVHRIAHLEPDGTLEVSDEVVAARIPVPPGGLWGLVGGRLVPVG